ncbi:Regulator of volume decrease after cellular swelling domain containing protein [Amanita muscaria]
MPTVSLISSVPHSVTKEESDSLSTSTPTSFNDLPPILAHKEDDVSVTFDPPVAGFSEQDGAHGTLHVLSSVLVFMSTTGRGFQIEYPSITLHAISRAGDRPSLYCQLDEETDATAEQLSHTNLNGIAAAEEGEEEEEQEDGEEKEEEQYESIMRELSIFPQNPQALEALFEALSQCASLHPDRDESDEEDPLVDPNNFEIFDGNEEEELSEIGRVRSDFTNSNRFAPY